MSEYLDGMLSASDCLAFEAHLVDCPSCCLEVQQSQETLTWLKQAAEVTPPPGLRAGVLARLALEPVPAQKPPIFAYLSRYGAVAAVFLLLIVGNTSLYRLSAGALPTKEMFTDGQPRLQSLSISEEDEEIRLSEGDPDVQKEAPPMTIMGVGEEDPPLPQASELPVKQESAGASQEAVDTPAPDQEEAIQQEKLVIPAEEEIFNMLQNDSVAVYGLRRGVTTQLLFNAVFFPLFFFLCWRTLRKREEA
jgi:hypothetical protein